LDHCWWPRANGGGSLHLRLRPVTVPVPVLNSATGTKPYLGESTSGIAHAIVVQLGLRKIREHNRVVHGGLQKERGNEGRAPK
jgi:hypothetical protein